MKLPSRFSFLCAVAVCLPVTKVTLAAIHHLPSHFRVVPSLVGDLHVGILEVEVGWVSVLVGVL